MDLAAKIRKAYDNGEIKTWIDVEKKFGLLIPKFTDAAKLQVIASAAILGYVLDTYVKTTEERLLKQQAQTSSRAERLLLAAEEDCWVFPNPNYKLYREQHPAFLKIWDVLFIQDKQLALNNGGTGSGKTAIGAAVVDKFIREGKHNSLLPLPFPVLWFTVKNAVQQTKDKLTAYGLGEYVDTVIHVFPYSALSCSQGEGRLYVRKEIALDPFEPDITQTIYEWLPMGMPVLCVVDEEHKLANRNTAQHKAMMSMVEKLKEFKFLKTKFLCMSATLAEKINDLEFIACAADIDYGGQIITPSNFQEVFARPIAKGRPDVVNAEAMKRAFNVFSPRLAEIPYVPWPYKAINAVRYYNFRTPEDRIYYKQSWERYVDRCEKLGKDAGANARYGPFLMFRKDVEPLRALQIADQMHEDIQHGFSPGMGTAFTAPIIKAIFYLMDTYGYTRDDIAVIWGGRANIKPEKILTPDDVLEIMQKSLQGDAPDKRTQKLLELNLLWQDDRLLFGDASKDEQDERYQRLLDLKLIGIQNSDKRQDEIAKFMSGRAKMCFFTGQSGGTGLSLEHVNGRGQPRRGYFSPIYSGKEFTQFLGRFPRRNSDSDTQQFVCLMANTIESDHVAPILDRKLATLGEFSTRKTDLATLLTQSDIALDKTKALSDKLATVRTLEQAQKQAHEDELTQVHASDNEEDDEDED